MRDLPRSRIKSGVPCIARQILNHWTTREAPVITVKKKKSHPIQAAFSWSKFSGKVRERGIQSPTEILHQCLPYLLLYLVEIYTNLFISLQAVTVSTETEASLAEITEVYKIGVWGHITGHTHNNNSGCVGEQTWKSVISLIFLKTIQTFYIFLIIYSVKS